MNRAQLPQKERLGPHATRCSRIGVTGVAIVLLVYALYVASTNAFLSLGGLGLLFKATNQVNATYQHAYTLWPGVVHVRQLRVTFQDQNVEFSLDIGTARVNIVLWELVRRRFHVTRVEGAGAVFRMRHRIDPSSKDEPWVSTLPPISEFPSPAVFEATVPEPPIPDEKYNLWTVHLEHVNVHIREVWVQFVKFEGTGTVRGAFRLVPARNLWVGPAVLELQGGSVSFGKERISSNLRGVLDCHVDPYDVRVPQGREVFRVISAKFSLNADGFRFDPFSQFFLPKDMQTFSKPGNLQIDVDVQHGRLLEGSFANYAAPTVRVASGDRAAIISNLHVEPRMDADAKSRIPITFERVTLETLPGTVVERGAGLIEAIGDDTTAEFVVDSSELDIPRFTVGDAHALRTWIPHSFPLAFAGGKLTGRLHARSVPKLTTAELETKLFNVKPTFGGVVVTLGGELRATFTRRHADAAGVSLAVDAKFEHATLLSGHGNPKIPPLSLDRASIHALLDAGHDDFNAELSASATGVSMRTPAPATNWSARNVNVTGQVTGSPRHAKGSVTVALGSFKVRSDRLNLAVAPKLRVTTSDFNVLERAGKLDAVLRFHGWNETFGDDGGQCSSLTVEDTEGMAGCQFSRHDVSCEIRAVIDNLAFLWGTDFKAQGSLRLSSTLHAPSFTPSSRVNLGFSAQLLGATAESGKRTDQGWRAHSDVVMVRGQFSKDHDLYGTLTVNAETIEGRIGRVSLDSAALASVQVSRLDPSLRELEFNGRVDIEHLAMTAGSRRIRDWRASINVSEARLNAQQNLDVSARFNAKMRDATPALGILEGAGKVPGWLTSVIPQWPLSTNGTVERRCQLTRLTFDQAAGGPLWARGMLLSTSALVRGSFLVRLSTLHLASAGINLGPPDAGFSPFVGESWLKENSERLDNSATAILSQPCHVEPQRCAGNGLGP